MLELLYEFRDDFAHGLSSRNAFHFAAAAAPVSPSSFKALEFLVPDSQSKHASSASPTFCSAVPAVPALAKNHIRKRREINFHL